MPDTRTLGPRMSLDELVLIFDGLFAREAYRLETLDHYESSLYRRWLAGEAYDRSGWDKILAGYAADGKTVCRVHLLPFVLTSYLVHEIEFYRGSVRAGEDIRLMPEGDAPEMTFDYWLFDRRLVAVMEYDESGVCTGVILTADPATVEKCVRWRDEAMGKATTLADYDRENCGMLRDGVFRKAGGSETHGCVEVAADDTGIRVRDSKDRTGPVLGFTDDEWRAFISGTRKGEFDLPG